MKFSRITYYILVSLILCTILYGISSLYASFHSGAPRVNKYDLGFHQLLDHNPEVTWLQDDPRLRGEINTYVRQDIEQSYVDAWGILNLSIKNKTDLGLSENFSDKKATQLKALLPSKDSIFREDLAHHLQLHFISYDKQVVSFSDKKMISKTTIKTTTDSVSTKDTSSYKVLMTLDDGKWRINKLIRVK